jgi:response regulator RpfG family c-di-GMP phosphodiesterase
VELKRTIFYIDDEAVCLDIFQKVFSDKYDVRTAVTLDEARRMLAECPADIVISDQSMPEIKGTDFLREVAATYPSSYRVLLTGSIHAGGVIREVGSGLIHQFIPKPWTEHDMRQMFERAELHFEVRRKAH